MRLLCLSAIITALGMLPIEKERVSWDDACYTVRLIHHAVGGILFCVLKYLLKINIQMFAFIIKSFGGKFHRREQIQFYIAIANI